MAFCNHSTEPSVNLPIHTNPVYRLCIGCVSLLPSGAALPFRSVMLKPLVAVAHSSELGQAQCRLSASWTLLPAFSWMLPTELRGFFPEAQRDEMRTDFSKYWDRTSALWCTVID
jgi:hypothetical protein